MDQLDAESFSSRQPPQPSSSDAGSPPLRAPSCVEGHSGWEHTKHLFQDLTPPGSTGPAGKLDMVPMAPFIYLIGKTRGAQRGLRACGKDLSEDSK